jgi:hypothetical protein
MNLQIQLPVLFLIGAGAAAANSTIAADGGAFTAVNRASGLRATFLGRTTRFESARARFALELERAGKLRAIRALGSRIEFARDRGITEWYENQERGLEHGFTLAAPLGHGPLVLTVAVHGDVTPRMEGSEIQLACAGRPLFSYTGLRSWDADGRMLTSRAEVEGGRIRLIVDDRGARYPVTVDPVILQTVLSPGNGPFAITGSIFAALNTQTLSPSLAIWNQSVSSSGNTWTQQATVNLGPPLDYGAPASIAADGDTVVVGTVGPALSAATTAAIFVYRQTGSTWSQEQIIRPADIYLLIDGDVTPNQLGASVAISGNTMFLGAPGSNSSSGAVYVFTRAGTLWSRQAVLTVPSGGEFGYSLAMDAGTLIVGAPSTLSADGSLVTGAAYVFTGSGGSWTQQAVITPPATGVNTHLGSSVAYQGGTAAFNASEDWTGVAGAVYVYRGSGSSWTLQATLTGNDTAFFDGFGGVGGSGVHGDAVAVGGNGGLILVGAPRKNTFKGKAYLFARANGVWSQAAAILPPTNSPAQPYFGYNVALGQNTAVMGTLNSNLAYMYSAIPVNVNSDPTGRTFTAGGANCTQPGTYTTPATGLWDQCTLQWMSPDTNTPGVRYTFESWSDGGANPRDISVSGVAPPPTDLLANFLTEYQLSAQSAPVSGGSISGGGFYGAGATAVVTAQPNPGFVFAGFTGAIKGTAVPQTIVMSAPQTVSAHFVQTPPATLSAAVTAKSGDPVNRQWTITLTNQGPGPAFGGQIFALTFTQTFGTLCTALPVRLSPVVLPALLGNLDPGTSVQLPVALDFTGCPVAARFTVGIGYMANSGSSGGLISLVNQFQ